MDIIYSEKELIAQLRSCHSCGILDYHKYWMIADHSHKKHDNYQLIDIKMDMGCRKCFRDSDDCYMKIPSYNIIHGVLISFCEVCLINHIGADALPRYISSTFDYCFICPYLTKCPQCSYDNDNSKIEVHNYQNTVFKCAKCYTRYTTWDNHIY